MRHHPAKALARAWRRVEAGAWPVAQQAAAAVLAWLIAGWIGDHPDPFFAPIAAVVALNEARGHRGTNAVRLLTGVIFGIVVGEVALAVLGPDTVSLALALLVAMMIAIACGGNRLVVAQAAAGAILTVAVGSDHPGVSRLLDALVGAGVALVFSQLLFTPEPVGLIRRAESETLKALASALELTSRALKDDDEDLHRRAAQKLGNLSGKLAELGRTRDAGARMTRYTLAWRWRTAPLAREEENADQLGYLGGSCLMLARTAPAVGEDERRVLGPGIHKVAGVLDAMSASPGDHAIRQRAADRMLETAADINGSSLEGTAAGRDAASAMRLVIFDVLVFAGVVPDEALAASRAGAGALEVPEPPASHWRPRFLRRHH